MPTPDNWVSGTLPKRGLRQPQAPRPIGAGLARRVARIRQREVAGPPLAVILQGRSARPARSHPRLYLGVLSAAGGLAVASMGLITGKPLLLVAGLVALAVAGALFWRRGTDRRGEGDVFLGLHRDAALLDEYFERVVPSLPATVVLELARVKELLAEVVERLLDPHSAGSIPVEEQFFVQEMIARYLRDACESYLSVVRVTREIEVAGGLAAPEQSLLAQMEILGGRLKNILAIAAAGEVERLARHQAFIESKR